MNIFQAQSSQQSLVTRIGVSFLAIAISFIIAGCMENTTPEVERIPIPLTAIPLSPQDNPNATSTPEVSMKESGPIVSPYIDVTVENVEFRHLETNPVQAEIVIRGTLPDQCKYNFYSVENRGDKTVKIKLSGIHPADNSCEQSVQTIEYVLLLGRDMPELERGFAPGEYEITVNNYKTTFTIKE